MPIFHLNARTATRASGASAAAAAAYIGRRGKYAKRRLDAVVFCASLNMPSWVGKQRHAPDYWRAADTYERANGRLFKSIEFALPLELNARARLQLAHEYVQAVACTDDGEPLPATFAIHAGGGSNPHVHALISERVNDRTPRDSRTWFSRAAGPGRDPSKGGARKTEDLKPVDWLNRVRELWATLANQALAAAGRSARIDHRSHAARGITSAPGRHLGLKAADMRRKGRHSTRAAEILHEAEMVKAETQLASQLAAEMDYLQHELEELRNTKELPSLTTALQHARNAAAKRHLPSSKSKGNPHEKGYDPLP